MAGPQLSASGTCPLISTGVCSSPGRGRRGDETGDRVTLRDWLVYEPRPGDPAFTVIDVEEIHPRPEDVTDQLGRRLRDAKLDPRYIDRMGAALGWGPIAARLARGRPGIRRGEFGEVLAQAIAETFEGWQFPVSKLRYQIDPEQTLPGTDLFGLRLTDEGATEVLFAESKLRTTYDKNAAVAAHDQLVEDEKRGFDSILTFVLQRMYVEASPHLGALESYLNSRDADLSTYGVFLTFETEVWREEVIEELAARDDLLIPLSTRAGRVSELRGLIDAVCGAAGVDLVAGDD